MSYELNFPIPYIPLPDRSGANGLGELWIGSPNSDPKTNEVDRVTVYIVRQNNTPLAIGQPIELSAGGVPLYNGSPVQLEVDGSYCMQIVDRLGAQIYYAPYAGKLGEQVAGIVIDINNLESLFLQFSNGVSNFAALGTTASSGVGQVVYLRQHTSGGYGGGHFIAVSGSVTSDGGRKRNSATPGIYWQRLDTNWHIEQFGAQPVVGFDSTAAITALIAASPWSGVADGSGTTAWMSAGSYEHGPITVNRPVTFKGQGKYSSYFLKRSAGVGFNFVLDLSASAGMEDLGLVKKSGFTDSGTGHGVVFGGGRSYAKNIYSGAHGGYGILLQDSNSSQFVGLETILNGSHGTAIIGRPSPNNNINGATVLNIDSKVNLGSGVYLENCFADNIIGATVQSNARYGIEFGPLTQLHNISGIYSEANTLGSGLMNAGSNANSLQYNIVEDANPVDNGTNNSIKLNDDPSYGLSKFNTLQAPALVIGEPSSGANGTLKLSDSGTQYQLTLEGTAGNATLEIKSSGAGTLTTKIQALYEDSLALTLQNSWIQGATFGIPTVYRDATGRCFLSGSVSGGTATSGTIIANLPAIYRSGVNRRLVTGNTSGLVFLNLLTNGNLVIDAGTNVLVALDGLNWHL